MEANSLKKYGVTSTNMLPEVKRKQHNNSKNYILGNEYTPPRTKRGSPEYREQRRQITKKSWKEGCFSRIDYSTLMLARWSDPVSREKMLLGMNSSSRLLAISTHVKKRWETLEYRSKMAKRSTNRVSKFQKEIYDSLNSPDWQLEYPIPNSNYTVDIIHIGSKVVIECNGTYWHCDPRKYSEGYWHQRVQKTAKDIWDKDSKKLTQLSLLGYKVMVIWEYDWNHGLVNLSALLNKE
jgi:G:T-mismatch repair DNA endonuclease (very short patch repair protein)